MKETKENTFLPTEQAIEILENITSNYIPDSEWQLMEPVLRRKDCLKEENVKEGD